MGALGCQVRLCGNGKCFTRLTGQVEEHLLLKALQRSGPTREEEHIYSFILNQGHSHQGRAGIRKSAFIRCASDNKQTSVRT